MHVALLGIGDTTGTPIVGCDRETCLAAHERGTERTRLSVHVQDKRTSESLPMDFSPDFHYQFLTQDVSLPNEVLVTRVYFDHLDGLGNVYHLLDDLSVYAAGEIDPVTGESVVDAIRSKFDHLNRISVEGQTPFESFRACGPDVMFAPVVHPPLVCYGVAIEDSEMGTKLPPPGDTIYAIPEVSHDMLRGPDLLLTKAIVSAPVHEYHSTGGDDYDEDGVARTFDTRHMICEGTIALGEEPNTDGIRPVRAAYYYPADEAFEEPPTVNGEVHDL